METTTENVKEPIVDCYDSELDMIKAEDYFAEKLAKAKAYFEKHGIPDFNKIMRDAEERKKQAGTL